MNEVLLKTLIPNLLDEFVIDRRCLQDLTVKGVALSYKYRNFMGHNEGARRLYAEKPLQTHQIIGRFQPAKDAVYFVRAESEQLR